MNDQEKLAELRHLLYNEIKGELSYTEKKEFIRDRIDEKVIAALHEKYLRRKNSLSVFIICYGIYLMAMLLLMLSYATNPVITGFVTFALILLPVFIIVIFNKSVLGYLKVDLVLRLITRFYARKNIPV